jgi:peptidoglycan/LPS O-acetylase OafA/YrhL
MVLYDHMVAIYLSNLKQAWQPKILLETYLINPLGIIQSFGFMGVALFFLVSGYIITHVASSESRIEFLIKRLCRIYPPLILSILVALLFSKWTGVVVPDIKSIFLNFSLFNYFQIPQVIIQGVAWSLVIEMKFYLVSLILLTSLQRWPAFHVVLQSILVGVCILYCRAFGDQFFLFAAGYAYIPYLLVGQLFYYHQRKRLPTAVFLLLVGLQFALIQWGIRTIHTTFLSTENSYLINFVFAFALFSILAMSNQKTITGLPKRVAEMSYSLYLLHGSVGIAMLSILHSHLPYLPSLLIAIVITLGSAWLSYLWIEKPSQKMARRWLASLSFLMPTKAKNHS